MISSKYPFLFATLGEAAARLPDDLARTLESTLAATDAANAPERTPKSITVINCLRRIRHVEAANGLP
ncbi:hypothetical protein ACODUL_17285 [Stenotrophomonas maltophilia]